MPQPIEYGKPSQAAHYGRGVGNIIGLLLAIRQAKKKKTQDQKDLYKSIVIAGIHSGQIDMYEGAKAIKQIDETGEIPEILKGKTQPPKKVVDVKKVVRAEWDKKYKNDYKAYIDAQKRSDSLKKSQAMGLSYVTQQDITDIKEQAKNQRDYMATTYGKQFKFTPIPPPPEFENKVIEDQGLWDYIGNPFKDLLGKIKGQGQEADKVKAILDAAAKWELDEDEMSRLKEDLKNPERIDYWYNKVR